MPDKGEMIPKGEALQHIDSMITRTALIHYAFTKTLVDALGEEKGKALAKRAIELYGKEVGKLVKERTLAKGLSLTKENYQNDFPALGSTEKREKVEVGGEKRLRICNCRLAKVWQELGVPKLGRIYCFVDQAKWEAFNPDLQCIHVKNVLDGDSYCELAIRPRK